MLNPQRVVSLTQVGIRESVCLECDRRPLDAAIEPAAALPCESQCEVFLLLPRLCDMVQRHRPEPPSGFGLAVHNLLRHARESHAIASTSNDIETNLPLHRHADVTLAVIEHVLRHEG